MFYILVGTDSLVHVYNSPPVKDGVNYFDKEGRTSRYSFSKEFFESSIGRKLKSGEIIKMSEIS